ncbi:MAG: hypothetical protein K2H73_07345 [Treponemataceae bacterium]|nr:hypothetical protein [Treponemataceae bacterium]
MNKLKHAIRNAEVDGLSDTLVRLFKADAGAQGDAFLTAVMAELEGLSAQITTAILQDKVLSRLEEADGARDEAIRTLGTVLAGYAALPVAAKKELALPLKAIYDKYAKAGITGVAYTGESSLTESMLEEFAAAALADKIKGLEGVGNSIAAVRAAQDAFTAANDEYVRSSAEKGASASSFNKPIVALINEKLVPYLGAMEIAGNASVAAFSKGVAAEIDRANDVIARRGKK